MKPSTPLFSLLLIPLTAAIPTTLSSLFKRDLLTSTSQNDLTNGSPCKPLTVIFARGTYSPGNVGENTGPPFFQAIANAIGAQNLAVQGVNYPALVTGFLGGGDANGSKKMAELVEQAYKQCPQTKVVMSGYSQGAQLVHNAARQLSAASTAKISSVVNFGDPNNGSAVGMIAPEKVKTFCNKGDNICDGGILVLAPHHIYGQNATQAAAFVKARAGL